MRKALTAPVGTQQPRVGALGSERATLLSARSEVLLLDNDADVRKDKIKVVQAAFSAGTYHVPASAVAARVVDYMLVL